MITVNLTENFFTLFGLPECYEIDFVALAERFRKLQHTVHPDKFANATDLDRRLSVQQSARINEAYQTLKNPLLRARYMLELKGFDMADDTDSAMDSEFLMEQMQLRERLEQIKYSADPINQLNIVNHEIDAALNELITKITDLFNLANKDALRVVYDYVRRMQFMMKLRQEIQMLDEEYS
ncbi:MAG: Fe-S protein assembly co-chaperone HscB [Gammaproteobacteria bacterium]|nr:Fe-S protein assembly co-chaperone HscB [Gammaproteobacteria bacterium]